MDKIISEIKEIGAADGYLCYHLQLSARNGTYELGAVRWGVFDGSDYIDVGDFDDYDTWDPNGEVGEGGPYHGAEIVQNDGKPFFQFPGYMTVHYPDRNCMPGDIEFTDPFDPRLEEILHYFCMSAEDLRKECELLKHAVENDESLETGEETDGSDEEPLGLIGSVRNTDVKAVEGHLPIGMGADKETALFLAAWNDNTRIMELLINAGSDVDFVHKHIDSGTVKKSALMVAAEYNNVKAVKLLLKAGADPNIPRRQGEDVTVEDSDGWTPLHEAASNGGEDMVSLLIEAGADVNVKDSDGRTPLDAACGAIHIRSSIIINLLKEAGAKE